MPFVGVLLAGLARFISVVLYGCVVAIEETSCGKLQEANIEENQRLRSLTKLVLYRVVL